MTAQEKLVKFMEEKARIIKEPNYFTEEDAKDILAWSDKSAEAVIIEISLDIKEDQIYDDTMCPFCVVQKNWYCHGCGYGIRHGKCNVPESDYQRLIEVEKRPSKPISEAPEHFLEILGMV